MYVNVKLIKWLSVYDFKSDTQVDDIMNLQMEISFINMWLNWGSIHFQFNAEFTLNSKEILLLLWPKLVELKLYYIILVGVLLYSGSSVCSRNKTAHFKLVQLKMNWPPKPGNTCCRTNVYIYIFLVIMERVLILDIIGLMILFLYPKVGWCRLF